MKRDNWFRLATFITIMIVSDWGLGKFCAYLYHSPKNNDNLTHKLAYTLDKMDEDIIILGSSRALNHFDSRLIYKQTGRTTYNCGFSGEGLAFSYIQLSEILKKSDPKMVIVDVSPNILLDPNSDSKLNILLPYIKKDNEVYKVYTKDKLINRFKLYSNLFQYNSTIYNSVKNLLKYHFSHKTNKDSLAGFTPLFGIIDTVNYKSQIDIEFPKNEIPQEKFLFLNKILKICFEKSIPILVIISPMYSTNSNFDNSVTLIGKMYNKGNGLYFMDCSKLPGLYQNNKLFYSIAHLNNDGASKFSETVSAKIREILQINPKIR